MTISAYPFVGSVAEAVGRLLKVQGVARIRDIRRRVNEKFGDREFVQRIVRYDISSFLDWGALLENTVKGQYVAGTTDAYRRRGASRMANGSTFAYHRRIVSPNSPSPTSCSFSLSDGRV